MIEGLRYDEADQHIVDMYKWHKSDTGYAVWRGVKDGKKQTIRLHRLLMNPPVDKVVDHKNGDKLDNRRSNLRICTQAENTKNRHNVKGYFWDKSRQKYSVVYQGKFCGRYDTEAEAITVLKYVRSGKAYVKTKRKYWHLPRGVTKQFGKYRVRPQLDGKRHWLGEFKTVDEAVEALSNWKERVAS